MANRRKKETPGSKGFSENWKSRGEAYNNYWTADRPQNQIQLAFRNHWELFQEYLEGHKGRKCLEVGCGRGTISSYFAAAGYECTLLDYSADVLKVAREIFKKAGLKGQFIKGDANKLPFPSSSFDVVVSIGLLEHFEDVATPLQEQVRVLKKNGVCFAYIVPHRPQNIQKYFNWINAGLKKISSWVSPESKTPKAPIYRNDSGSERYLKILKNQPVRDIQVHGVYPLPMISHSPEFPFSLLPEKMEFLLTRFFETVLKVKGAVEGSHPWICDESMGQAFLVVFFKK